MATKTGTKTGTKSRRATSKASEVFTAEERAALQEVARERKTEARRGKDKAAEGERDVLAKIADMPKSDREMAERFHAIVRTNAPDLRPKTWYGMPAYANEAGKIVCFFQAADKFKARYATIGFDEAASLDEGNLWPTSWALTKLTAADEAKIVSLVKKAVG